MPKYVDLGYNGTLSIAEIMAASQQNTPKDVDENSASEKEKGGK